MLKNVISGIEGGKMTRAEANEEAKKIYEEWNRTVDEIENKAKEDGIWINHGLDSNNYLFKEAFNKAKEKLKKLKEMIDEE